MTTGRYTNGYNFFSVPSLGLLITFAFMALGAAYAQNVAYHVPHTGETILVDGQNFDRFTKSSSPPHLQVGPSDKGGGNLTFNLTFSDVSMGTGRGFDHPTLGETRRATVAHMAAYINEVLRESSGAVIDVWFEVSELDADGSLAFAGTFWEIEEENRYDNGFAYQHIKTGVDPSEELPDIIVTLDFGYTWNSDMDTPTSSEYDLGTLVLHELTHGLGFTGLTDAAGNSRIEPFGNPGVFTDFTDALVKTTDNFDFWNDVFTFVGTPDDLISNKVAFGGTYATAANGGVAPRVYAPSPFSDGSSLSHWNVVSFADQIMKPAFSRGTQQLTYGDVDIGYLRDIGYTIEAPATPDCPDALMVSEQHTAVLLEIPVVLDEETDLDTNGIPDVLEIALFLKSLCRTPYAFHEKARVTYLSNIALIDSEIPALSSVKEFAAVGAAISTEFIGATPLASAAAPLLSVLKHRKGGVSMEPFSAGGDADLDGVTNLEEFNNAEASGGDYVLVALDPFLDGSEGPDPIPVGGGVALGVLLACLLGLGVRCATRNCGA